MHVSDVPDARSPRRRLPTLIACAVLAVAASGVAGARASAASITVLGKCVVNVNVSSGSPMVVLGAGFTPGDAIQLTTDKGAGFGSGTADANGAISITMTGPVLARSGPDASMFALTAKDETDGVTTATTSFPAANLAVATKPTEAKPRKKVTYFFSGFLSGTQIYAHYMHKKKITATKRFGKAIGSCGTLTTKASLYPGRQKYSSYKVQFDDAGVYTKKAVPRLVETLNIFHF